MLPLVGAGCLTLMLSSTLLLQACAPRSVAERYPDGQTKREGQVADGIQVGQWHYWYADGHAQAVGSWANDKQDGPWRYWWADGSLQAEGSYANGGQRTGLWRHSHVNGQLASEGSYRADRQNGLWSYWYGNGARCAIGTFVEGLRSGLWRTFDTNGHQVSQQLYYQGVAVGPQVPKEAEVAFGESFEVLSAGIETGEHWWAMVPSTQGATVPVSYPGLAVDGVFALIRADGSGRASSTHHQHGVAMSWYGDGVIASSGELEHGVKSGIWRYYGVDGVLLASLDYSAASAPATASPEIAASIRSIELQAGNTSTLVAQQTTEPTPAPAATPAPAVAEAPAPASAPPAVSPTPQLPSFWTKHEEGSAASWISHYEHSENGLPAVSPMPQLPSFWTKHEEGSAASWIGQYEHGGDHATDPYTVDPEISSTRPELLGKPIPQTRFLDSSGNVIDLGSYHKPLVVVLMRGFSGQVCLYCAAQTVALCKHLDEFHKAGAEVIIIYPGPAESAPAFLSAVASLQHEPPPMPVALDVSLGLVRALGVEDNLARPTSLVLDATGKIHFAYVGKTIADRPSADDLLREVHRIVE